MKSLTALESVVIETEHDDKAIHRRAPGARAGARQPADRQLGRAISFDSSANVRRSTSQSNSGDLGSLLLDYFAYVADTLTCYQDATANEGYLGTACDPTC